MRKRVKRRNKIRQVVRYHEHRRTVQKPYNKNTLVDVDQHTDTSRAVTKEVSQLYNFTGRDDAFRLCCDVWLATLTRYQPGSEERYMELIKDLPRPALDCIVRGFGHLMNHFVYQGRYCDVLGQVYMEIRSSWGGKFLGQFFTPWSLCMLAARTTMRDDTNLRRKVRLNKRITVHDPCVGSASQLLAARAVVAEKYGRWAARLVQPSGQDSDPLCVAMSKIQLLLTDDRYMVDLLMATTYDMAKPKG